MRAAARPLGIRLAALAVVATAIGGCFSAAAFNAKNRAALLRRASFDFQCPEAELDAVELQRYAQNDDFINSYGVRGCGHRASYVLNNSTWVANVVDGQASGGEAPSAVPPPSVAPAP